MGQPLESIGGFNYCLIVVVWLVGATAQLNTTGKVADELNRMHAGTCHGHTSDVSTVAAIINGMLHYSSHVCRYMHNLLCCLVAVGSVMKKASR